MPRMSQEEIKLLGLKILSVSRKADGIIDVLTGDRPPRSPEAITDQVQYLAELFSDSAYVLAKLLDEVQHIEDNPGNPFITETD